MVEILANVLRILAALFLVALNGFFVAAEFAFVRIRETSVDQLVEQGKFGSKSLAKGMDELDDYLAVTQLGITIASIALGSVGEPAVAALVEPLIGAVVPEGSIHIIAFVMAFSVVTFLHVVLGELAPKTLSIQRTERIALFVAPPMTFFRYLFAPGIVVFNGAANGLTSLFGVSPASESEDTLNEDELRRAARHSLQKGQVDKTELEMIESVFELDDIKVKEVMIPRPDTTTVHASQSVESILDTVLQTGHSRYPVTEQDGDDILGFITVKDVFRQYRDEKTLTETPVEDIMRDILVVPESTSIDDTLSKFRADQTQIAAVIDEWGALEGVVTVEDVIEVMVGDLRDEFDTKEQEASITKSTDGWTSDGGVPLAVVSDTIGHEFTTEDFDTIGGLVLSKLDKVPTEGETVTDDSYDITVTEMRNNRISTVEIAETAKDQ